MSRNLVVLTLRHLEIVIKSCTEAIEMAPVIVEEEVVPEVGEVSEVVTVAVTVVEEAVTVVEEAVEAIEVEEVEGAEEVEVQIVANLLILTLTQSRTVTLRSLNKKRQNLSL